MASRGATARRRGHRAEQAVARWLREHGWPDARTTRDARGGSQGGADICGVPGWAIEVKDRAEPLIDRWWQQAIEQAGPTMRPLLVWHPVGVADPGDWAAMWFDYDEAFPGTTRPVRGSALAAFAALDRPVVVGDWDRAVGSLAVWAEWATR